MTVSIDERPTYTAFVAKVALKMRDDYDIGATFWLKFWPNARVRTYFNAGDDVATAAFKIVNENAVRHTPSTD